MAFDQELVVDIIGALENDSILSLRYSAGKDALRYGRCPDCSRKSVWINAEKPWVLCCDHETSCGYKETVKDRYPDLFSNFSSRHPATDEDPNATAKAYLRVSRGFPIDKIGTWFKQGFFKLPDGSWAETVRFDLFGGDTWYWERIIDANHVKLAGKKARFKTGIKYSGKHWEPPRQKIVKNDRVFIVEGIFHAIALHLAGYQVVAAFSCGNLPRTLIAQYKDYDIKWCMAYDDEPAARKHMTKYVYELKELNQKYEVALTGGKDDWDDIYRAGQLDKKFMEDCIWRGRIFTAPSVRDVAYALYGWKQYQRQIVEFKNRLFGLKVDVGELSKELEGPFSYGFHKEEFVQALTIHEVANCIPDFLHIERDKFTEEQKYIFEIRLAHSNIPILIQVNAAVMLDARSFSQALLGFTPGGNFEGSAGDLKLLTNKWFNRSIDYVQTIPFVGYEEESKTYVFPTFGYKNGKLIESNKHGYLKAGNTSLKTNLSTVTINNNPEFKPYWVEDFIKVFHLNGVAALAFWVASLFTRQIKVQQGAFTFLELTGEKEAGKSTLIRFMWKLFGRDNFEGIDILTTSASSEGRQLAQLSNMPIVLVESDREPVAVQGRGGRPTKMVDWDSFKKITELDGVLMSRGVKTNDNKTNDTLFRGALVITQNESVQASTAMLSRIVHLHFTTAHKKAEYRPIADKLKATPVEDLSGFLHHCLQNENRFLETFHIEFLKHRERLSSNGDMSSHRVVDFHAQVMAAVSGLCVLVPQFNQVKTAVHQLLVERADIRQKRLVKDHPILEQFWETYQYLNHAVMHIETDKEDKDVFIERLNHSNDSAFIAINLNEFYEQARKHGQELIPINDLKKLLPNTTRYPYVDYKQVRSRKSPFRVKCWVFKKESK